MAISKKRVLTYGLLPGIFPRIGSLFGTGFYHIAYLVAIIYGSVRLLPRNHPYLDSRNLGRFGVTQVIAEAANNISFNRQNIDQIFIFFALILGLLIVFMQIVLVGFAFAAQPVYAVDVTDITFANWFTLNTGSAYYPFDETNDIALMTLDRVFGVVGIFNSCISTAATCTDHLGDDIYKAGTYPYPMHLALHQLFRLYSTMIGVISLMIILYYVITIIGETAVSGTAFGQRFNRAWAPVRLILFFALLAPLNIGGNNEGLNGAQLITLWTAKFGSNFATNAWGLFNVTTARSYYDPERLIAVPARPQFGNMAQFWTVANACIFGQKILYNKDIFVYLVRDEAPVWPVPPIAGSANTAHPDAKVLNSLSVLGLQAAGFNGNTPARIVIGEQDTTNYNDYPGAIKPICGEYTVPMVTNVYPAGSNLEIAARIIFERYYMMSLVYAPLDQTSPVVSAFPAYNADIRELAQCTVRREIAIDQNPNCDPADPYASYAELVQTHMANLNAGLDQTIRLAIDAQINPAAAFAPDPYLIADTLVARGWAGAAIWYNRIAKLNGSIASALFARPIVKSWPMVMEEVKRQQRANSETVIGSQLYSPLLPATSDNPVARDVDLNNENYKLAAAYYNLYKFWEDNVNIESPDVLMNENAVIDTINAIFGTTGLFSMRQPAPTGMGNPHPGNQGVHPLALLSSLGRSMMEASIQNLGIAAGATIGGGVMSIMRAFTTGQIMASTASKFFSTVAYSTILIGFVLYYVLPFLPFIYFFFAMGGWIKSIFEAMVAMPIWALAHVRIDGEGVPGPGASNGYFLLFEILVRPILILIGLISSILIFSALVTVLNSIFDLVVVNLAGTNRATGSPMTPFYRGPIDELFYSIMYAAIVYMMGLSCFKLIDQVPNNILRWMGVSVATFQETAGDQVSQMPQMVYSKGNMTVGQISGFTDGMAGRVAGMIR